MPRLSVATLPQISGDALKGEVWLSGPLRLGGFVLDGAARSVRAIEQAHLLLWSVAE